MTTGQFLELLSETLTEGHTGILATASDKGQPAMRWMTPTVMRSSPGLLYAVTSKRFDKCRDLESNPQAQWMIQTKTLTRIINIYGEINIIDSPSLRAKVMEAIGPHLRVFWKVNDSPEDLVILETVIKKATVFTPMAGKKVIIDFNGESKS